MKSESKSNIVGVPPYKTEKKVAHFQIVTRPTCQNDDVMVFTINNHGGGVARSTESGQLK
jgi:hypothetical protein